MRTERKAFEDSLREADRYMMGNDTVPFSTEAQARAYTRRIIAREFSRIDSIQQAALGMTRDSTPVVSVVASKNNNADGGEYFDATRSINIYVGSKKRPGSWLQFYQQYGWDGAKYRTSIRELLAHELGHDLAHQRSRDLGIAAHPKHTSSDTVFWKAYNITSEGIAAWYESKTFPRGRQASAPITDTLLAAYATDNCWQCDVHDAGWVFVAPIARKGGQEAIDYLLRNPLRATDLDHLVAKRDSIMAKF